MYATKRRRRNVRPHTKPSLKDAPQKSNPSKRHRERLNSELEMLASLLPFEQNIITKLDKLSILRLAVSYLRTKSYFHAALNDPYTTPPDNHLHRRLHHRIVHGHHLYADVNCTDSENVLQALSGFLFVVTCDGEVFFASHTVEQYLGFHQSDIIHQSALELIHSEDREHFKFQLSWRQTLPGEAHDLPLEQTILPENIHLLQRCFRVRFRCLLDNASGFITLEITGKIRPLLGQNCKSSTNLESQLALFALCCPFGPLPLSDMPPRDYTFKSKHKMDMSPLTMDPRGRLVFEFTDEELTQMGGYDLVHPDDLNYHAAAHLELIKTGSSGLIAYRLMTKDFKWVWLQTSSRVIYKNSKPDFILCIHRHLTEDEGMDLVKKRGSEFKLPYPIIDADPTDLTLSCHSDESPQQHVNGSCPTASSNNNNNMITNGKNSSKHSPKYKKSKSSGSVNGGVVSIQQATSTNGTTKKQRKLSTAAAAAKAEFFYSPNGTNLANVFGLNALYTSNINCFGYNNGSVTSSSTGSAASVGYNYNGRHFYDARILSAAGSNNDNFYHHKSSQYSIKPDSLGQSYASQTGFDPAIFYRGYQTFYSSFQVASPMNEMALRHHYGRYYDFHQLQAQQDPSTSSNNNNYYSEFQRNNHNYYQNQQHLTNDCCANYPADSNNDEEFNNSNNNNNNNSSASPSNAGTITATSTRDNYYNNQDRYTENGFISRYDVTRYSDCEKEKSCSPREVTSTITSSEMLRGASTDQGSGEPQHHKMLKSYLDWGAIDDILPSCLYANNHQSDQSNYTDHPFFYHVQSSGYPNVSTSPSSSSPSRAQQHGTYPKNVSSDDNDENTSPSVSPSCDDDAANRKNDSDCCWSSRHVSVVRHNSKSKLYGGRCHDEEEKEKALNNNVHGVATSVIQMPAKKSKQIEPGENMVLQVAKATEETSLDWSNWSDRRNKENEKVRNPKESDESGIVADKKLNLVDQHKIACFAAGSW